NSMMEEDSLANLLDLHRYADSEYLRNPANYPLVPVVYPGYQTGQLFQDAAQMDTIEEVAPQIREEISTLEPAAMPEFLFTQLPEFEPEFLQESYSFEDFLRMMSSPFNMEASTSNIEPSPINMEASTSNIEP